MEEKEEKERLLKEKELEPLRKKKEFWFELSGLDTEKELQKVDLEKTVEIKKNGGRG